MWSCSHADKEFDGCTVEIFIAVASIFNVGGLQNEMRVLCLIC